MDPGGFSSGLEKAGRQLTRFAALVPNALGRHTNAISGLALGPIEAALVSVKKLATSIPFIGAALAAVPVTGAEFVTFITAGMDKVASLSKLSDQVGISTERMGGLMLLAGGDTEVLEKSLFKLNNKLGEVLQGNQAAIDGFEKLGLSAQDLAAGGADKALTTLAMRYRELPSAMDRARLLQETFGKSGREMGPVLARVATEMDSATAKAKAMGLGFSRVDGQQIILAKRALHETELAIQGLQTQLSIQLAPFISAAADKFNELGQSGTNMGEKVSAGLRTGSVAVAYLSDGVKDLINLSKLLNSNPFDGSLKKDFKQLFDRPRDADSANKFFDDINKKAKLAAQASLNGLNGKGGGAGLGSVADQQAAAKAAQDLLDLGQKLTDKVASPAQKFATSMKEAKDLLAKGAISAQVYDQAITHAQHELGKLEEVLTLPTDKFRSSIGEYAELLEVGAISQNQYALAVESAVDNLAKSQEKMEAHAPRGIERGSQEDISTLATARGEKSRTAQERVANLLQQQFERQLLQLKAAQDTATAVQNLAEGSF